MINAVIQNGDQTAVLKLPDDPFTLQYDLSQIGVRIRLRDIPIKDDEDSAIQVKLFADSDIGNTAKWENCRKLSVPCVMRGLLSMEAAVCTSMWTLPSIPRRA